MQTSEAAAAAGVTVRQLNYWRMNGYVTATPHPYGDGTGYPVEWSPTDVALVRRIGQLVVAGLEVAAAARLARDLAEHPDWPILLAPGVLITMTACWHPDDLHPFQAEAVAAVAELAR